MEKTHHGGVLHPIVLLIQVTAASEVRLLLLLPPSLLSDLIKTIIIILVFCLSPLLDCIIICI